MYFYLRYSDQVSHMIHNGLLPFGELSSVTTHATIMTDTILPIMKGLRYGQSNRPLYFHIARLNARQLSQELVKSRSKIRGGCENCSRASKRKPTWKIIHQLPVEAYLNNNSLKIRRWSKAKRLRYKLPKSQVYKKSDQLGTYRVILMYNSIISNRLDLATRFFYFYFRMLPFASNASEYVIKKDTA